MRSWIHRIKASLEGVWDSELGGSPLSKIPWSAIRRVGQSRLLALTIVIPFLGSLLLFNQYIVELLSLSPELVKRLFPNVQVTEDITRQLTLNRLYYLYFGLSFLGIGSFLFALVCPNEIKSSASLREHIELEAPLLSKTKVGLILPDVASRYINWDGYWDGEDWIYPPWLQRVSQPHGFLRLFQAFVIDAYAELPHDELASPASAEAPAATSIDPPHLPDAPPAAEPPTEFPDQNSDEEVEDPYEDPYEDLYTDARGHPDPDKIAQGLQHQRRIDIWLIENMRDAVTRSEARGRDLLALQYLSLDHSKPLSRLFVSTFYLAGFGLLLVPTVTTFFQLAFSFSLSIIN